MIFLKIQKIKIYKGKLKIYILIYLLTKKMLKTDCKNKVLKILNKHLMIMTLIKLLIACKDYYQWLKILFLIKISKKMMFWTIFIEF